MPLPVLLALVVGGIAAIAVMLHGLGLSARHRFASEGAARAAWEDAYPDLPALEVRVSRDKSSAFVRTAQGNGLVWPLGADVSARRLDRPRVRPAKGGLVVQLDDFTAPRIYLRLDREERDDWGALLEAS